MERYCESGPNEAEADISGQRAPPDEKPGQYAPFLLADKAHDAPANGPTQYLGHSDAGFTLRTYTHLMPSSDERTRKAIDTALGGYMSATSEAL